METTATTTNQTLNYKQWALYIFLASLPIIGLILLLVWAFGDGNLIRKEWAKGMLLILVIVIILSILFSLIFGVGLFSILQQ